MLFTRTVLLVVYDGFELLDLAGPLAVFNAANLLAPEPPYRVRVVSMAGGLVADGAGIALRTEAIGARLPVRSTVLVMGALGDELRRAMGDPALLGWLRRVAPAAERLGSVCTGAFVLGAAGLLDAHRATTHWMGCDQLSTGFPGVRVDPNALYVADGKLWTSAGVTAGIDMALALVRADTDAALMGRVARRLVVYAHRPGGQSQFSETLEAQTASGGAFAGLIDWIEAHLADDLGVASLAARVGMSERSFHRKFVAATGRTPARFVDELRLRRASGLLSAGLAVKDVARRIGFTSESGFRAAFVARYGLSPRTQRALHAIDG